jgi:hypothetical protein
VIFHSRIVRTKSGLMICVLLLLIFGTVPASAQHHEVGAAWIHRDAPQATQVHLEGDPLCFAQFDADCFGGMMAPDSLLCELEPLAEHEWPEQCPIAIECSVSDSHGHHLLDGTGMHSGMMRREVLLTVHYNTVDVERMGIDPAGMCLAMWNGESYEERPGAIHDLGAATFVLSTLAPSGKYAVLPRATVPASVTSVSEFKARH